ncbi:uncharacterized protein LOC117180712 [Belonocnema kinseyi]|uniref:uncharacterized protein LOC117180712 n=1 Tax=Belonocnema kinseyi TaxID=2817044 RepID=UPI00143D16E5|nr:uncharacterized protein LOC117180712 [Belonocnema kinseyi]
MEFPVSLLFLLIICYSGNILGQNPETVNVLEPIGVILTSKAYSEVCHIQGLYARPQALQIYYHWAYLKSKTDEYIEKSRLCRDDSKMYFLSKSMVKKFCDSQADQLRVAHSVHNSICSVIQQVTEAWRNGRTTRMHNVVV